MRRKNPLVAIIGVGAAILLWIFCIVFTVTMITGQKKQINQNNETKETVIIYIEESKGNDSLDETKETQPETKDMKKYYMIDENGNYIPGTLPYMKDNNSETQ